MRTPKQAPQSTATAPDPTALIFDIQHYAVNDGPGIRTLVFFKGCPLRCAWCSNPESQAITPEVRYIQSLCRHCGACHDRTQPENCPHDALRPTGQLKTVTEVFTQVAADIDFYRNSGGGVTLSGGEPLLHPDFCQALLSRCREAGIHTTIETAGDVPPSTITAIEPLTDLFLFDVKLADSRDHHTFTGHGNEQILGNLATLARIAPDKVLVRIPLIPGITDTAHNIEGICSWMSSHHLTRAELLSFHRLGEDKYAELGRPLPVGHPIQSSPHPPALSRENLVCIFKRYAVALHSAD